MRQHIDFEKIKCVVLASPGFVKDEFLEYCLAECVRQDARDIIEHKSKFLCCHSSSGYKHSLQEAMADPGVAAQLSDTKAAGEVRALADFNTMMGEDPDRAYYGPVHVRKAAEMGAKLSNCGHGTKPSGYLLAYALSRESLSGKSSTLLLSP